MSKLAPAILCLALALAALPTAAAQDADLAGMEAEAARASEAGDYGRAAAVLRRARSLWPQEPRVPVLLGDLYTDRSLHALALDEYLAAEGLDPADPGTLQRIADAYGYLNREEDSIAYLRRILERDSSNVRAAGDLGWMLFKTHRLREGVALLEDAELRMGRDMGFDMTLGTLRSELFDYEESRRRYEEAIVRARAEGFSRFASVAYYNLSLLESRFRRWDRALEAADLSLQMEARSSGYLARGELRLRRLELGTAEEDFTSAFGVDTTPLARLSLAEAALAAGRLDEALAWVREVAVLEEHPWMSSFGTDPDSFAMDLHDLLREIHAGRAALEKARPKRGLPDAAASLALRIVENLRAAYHEGLFRRYARAVAAAYGREGAELPAAAHALVAFRRYPGLASRYLDKARSLEESYVPESRTANDLEAALLVRDPGALESALARLDPVWERDLAAEGLAGLAKMLSRGSRRPDARSALERLWILNPGALPRHGFSVPALLKLESVSKTTARTERGIVRALRKLGIVYGKSGDGDYAFEFRLRLGVSGAEYTLAQRQTGAILRKGTVSYGASKFKAGDLADFLFRDLHRPMYTIPDEARSLDSGRDVRRGLPGSHPHERKPGGAEPQGICRGRVP